MNVRPYADWKAIELLLEIRGVLESSGDAKSEIDFYVAAFQNIFICYTGFYQILFLVWQGDLFDVIPFLIVSLIIWFVSKSRYFRLEEDDSDFILLISFYFALTVVFLGSTEKLVLPFMMSI